MRFTMKGGWRRLGKVLVVLVLLAAVLGIAGFAVLSSDWAKNRARVLLEQQITQLSGGRAEIASLDYNLFALRAELGGFILHGTESPEQEALFRASRIVVDATALSWLGKQFRVESVVVDRPAFNLYIDAEGRNNLPKPPGPGSGKPFTHTIIDLGVGRFEVRQGIAKLAQQTVPLDVRGDNLDLTLNFERAAERYRGAVSAQRLQFSTGTIQPVPFDFRAAILLERDRLELSEGRLAYGESMLNFSATLDEFQDPRIVLPFDGDVRVKDFHKEFRLPVEPLGAVTTKGEFRYEARAWQLTGSVDGNGLAFRSGAVRVADIGLRSSLALDRDSFVFDNLTVRALSGEVRGKATLRNGTELRVEGTASDLSLDRVSRASGVGPLAYNAKVAGTVQASATLGARGVSNSNVQAKLNLEAAEGENPLSGVVDASFAQRDQALVLRESSLRMANSFVELSGDMREALQVNAGTTRFEDLLPALALFSESPETLIPVRLGGGGEARFRGTIRGEWNAPVIEGDVAGKAIHYETRSLDAISARVELNPDLVRVRGLVARKADAELRGSFQVPLEQWKPATRAPLEAALTLRAAGLKALLAEAGQAALPISGAVAMELNARGTIDAPEAALSGSLRNGSAWGERFDEAQVRATYAGDEVRVAESRIRRGQAAATLQGSYRHRAGDYASGNGQASVRFQGLTLNDIPPLRNQKIDAQAALAGESVVRFQLRAGDVLLDAIDGGVEVANILYGGEPAGSLSVSAKSSDGVATIALRGKLAEAGIDGNATVGLKPDYPAKARVNLEQLSLDSIRPWLPDSMDRRRFPLEASVVSTLSLEGNLGKPEQLRGELLMEKLRLATVPSQEQTLDRRTQFELRNAKPLRFVWDGRRLTASDVTLEGTGTQLTVAGSITPSNPRQQLDLQARGSVNLNVFNAFEPTVDADGKSELDLTVRGTFQNPDVYGLLDLNDASLYLTGVPNGLDKINGRVFLYRDRANIEEIRAESGGGSLTLSGFVSYNQGVPAFRLSARGTDVRVRYPPGVSTSADAALELTGSRNQSILSGTVSVTRVALNPRSDLGSILTNTSKPVATPSASQNDFLRNMRFDVRVQTAPDVRFDSSLTQDLAGEADLRLRGNPYTPVLLGTVNVNQGEVNFFGNRYYIDRGEISFLNPLKMEPVLNLDLRTRVRSIDVTLTFSGPLDKLNINYRSDPPLQLNEIIALLTVGRAPAGSPSLAQAQNEAAQSWQQIGASALVGEAVAAPIAGRLQKFFGVSRIKIDPRLTGVENNPQARLTVEQQVNRNITVTFITNLADAQQQIVRLEWNFNPDWSMVALRDEDGLFGVDFLFRKRF